MHTLHTRNNDTFLEVIRAQIMSLFYFKIFNSQEIRREPFTCPADRYSLDRDKVRESIIKSVLKKLSTM